MNIKKTSILLCALLLLLTSCEHSQTKQLNATFSEVISIDSAVMKNLDTEIQNVNLKKDYDDVSFQINQTFGDEKFLYIILDVTFKNKQDFEKFVSEDYHSNLNLYYSDREENDELLPIYKNVESRFNSSSSTLAIHHDTNTISYFISLIPSNYLYYFNRITFYVSEITVESDGGEKEILAPGPYSISWEAENTGKLYSGKIQDSDTDGTVQVSSFGLIVHFNRSRYVSVEELENSITIMQDGVEFPLNNTVSGSCSSKGECNFIIAFPALLNLDQLDSLQIGDQVIDLVSGKPEI